MNVEFVSREVAKEMIRTGDMTNYDLISFSDTKSECNEMRHLWKKHKGLYDAAIFQVVHDINDASSCFTPAKVMKVIEFINTSGVKKKSIMVHCYAGISRSAATAKFANLYLKLGIKSLDEYSNHNWWMFYELCELANIQTMRSYYTDLEQNKN